MNKLQFHSVILKLGLCLTILSGCHSDKENRLVDPIIGVKIYEHQGEFSHLFKQWSELGINTLFTSVELYSNPEFRTLAKENEISSFIILPIFFDPESLNDDPELHAITGQGRKAIDDWVTFVCPSRAAFREQKIEQIKRLVTELDPDGLSIDFIRHFVFWEKVYPDTNPDSLQNSCFDSSCMTIFQQSTGIKIPDSFSTPAEILNWIRQNHFTEWTQWKCGLITSMVHEIALEARKIKPGIKINVHLVPWRQNDFNGAIRSVVGQDFSEIAKSTDYLSPMTYAHMVKQTPQWIHSVVMDTYKEAGGMIIPSIQVSNAYLEEELTAAEFKKSLLSALKPPSRGVIFWSWATLDQSEQKKEIVKNIIGN